MPAHDPLDPPRPPWARRNLITLFSVSMLIGVGVALYNVTLPLFLKERGLSWKELGWVYSGAGILVVVIRVGLGAWSDRIGRKTVYVVSLVLAGACTGITPFFSAILIMGALKSVVTPSIRARESMHAVLLFEDSPRRFRKLLGRTRGLEFMFHFFVLLAASILLSRARVSMSMILVGAGGAFLLSAAVFAICFHGHTPRNSGKPRIAWADLLKPKLSRPMWIMTGSLFVFALSIEISHCFALQLFFQEKFGATDSQILMVGAFHRLSAGLPLLVVGNLIRNHLKRWLMVFLIIEGVFIIIPGFMAVGGYSILGWKLPGLWVTMTVWLFHDLVGMGVWLPAQQELLQRYSRPETRGRDVSLATALGALGLVGGPLIAGWLRGVHAFGVDFAVNLPFIVSGIGVMLSALILIPLPRHHGSAGL